jgi:hypothetical protein
LFDRNKDVDPGIPCIDQLPAIAEKKGHKYKKNGIKKVLWNKSPDGWK